MSNPGFRYPSEINHNYASEGFAIFHDPIIFDDRISLAREGMLQVRDGIYETGCPPDSVHGDPNKDPHVLCKINQPQKANRGILELIRSPEIGARVAAVTGAEMVQVWAVQLLHKPPLPANAIGSQNVGWHQDWTYWSGTWEPNSEVLTAWLALSDVSAESGPMQFVPGSHLWRNAGGGDFFNQDMNKDSFDVPAHAKWHEVPAVMRAGGMSLHHRLTIHGSSANTSLEPRLSLAIHLRTEKSRPLSDGRGEFAGDLHNLDVSPVIYGKLSNI